MEDKVARTIESLKRNDSMHGLLIISLKQRPTIIVVLRKVSTL